MFGRKERLVTSIDAGCGRRRVKNGLSVLAVTLIACAAFAGPQGETARAGTMHQIYVADQADREPPGGDLSKLDWSKIGPRDEARRREVRAMLVRGELKTGADFREAAMVFQHGSGADDILFAHVLAMAALAKGDQESRKLCAMTLDRYLHRIGKPQIFGNDYQSSGKTPMTQEPFDRALVPEKLRALFCVPNDHIQQVMLDAFQHNRYPDLSKYQAELPCKHQ